MIKQYINRYLDARTHEYFKKHIEKNFPTHEKLAQVEAKLTQEMKINHLIQENQKVILKKLKNIQEGLIHRNDGVKSQKQGKRK